jgi:hypothetical protein
MPPDGPSMSRYRHAGASPAATVTAAAGGILAP